MLILRTLKHPNIVRLVTAMERNSIHAIVFELCEFSLGFELKFYKNGLPERRLLKFMHEFTLAYAYLRDQKIVHLDLKPDNVFIGSDYAYKIGDFGTAEILPDGHHTETLCGSYYYVHPDVLEAIRWRHIHPDSYLGNKNTILQSPKICFIGFFLFSD